MKEKRHTHCLNCGCKLPVMREPERKFCNMHCGRDYVIIVKIQYVKHLEQNSSQAKSKLIFPYPYPSKPEEVMRSAAIEGIKHGAVFSLVFLVMIAILVFLTT